MADNPSTIGRQEGLRSLDFLGLLKLVIPLALFVLIMFILRILCNLCIDLVVLCDRESAIRTLSEIRRKICPWWHPRTQPQQFNAAATATATTSSNGDNTTNNRNATEADDSDSDNVLSGLTSREKKELLSCVLVHKMVTEKDMKEWRNSNGSGKFVELAVMSGDVVSSSSSVASSEPGSTSGCSSTVHRMICPICINDLEVGCEVVATRTCHHMFHTECLNQWLVGTQATDCPYCRTQIITEELLLEASRMRTRGRVRRGY